MRNFGRVGKFKKMDFSSGIKETLHTTGAYTVNTVIVLVIPEFAED